MGARSITMDLFDDLVDSKENLLPSDGEVNYYGKVLEPLQADAFFSIFFKRIAWQNDQALIYGKRILTKRKVAWYADRAFSYTYSQTTKVALSWTPELIQIKQHIETVSGEVFNACLLNLYHSGEEGMAWHSDAERELKPHAAIASVSLGAERKFSFKHKSTKETRSIFLQHGSLLIMKGATQKNWLHRLPPTKKIVEPRINLTFRYMLS